MSERRTELQALIDFTQDDLAANQRGVLSIAQRETLAARQQRSRQLLIGVGVIVAFLSVGALLFGTTGIILMGIIALILGVMGIVEYVIGYQTYTHDLEHNQVETIQGVVRYVWRGESAMGIPTSPAGIRIGDMQFLFTEAQTRAFEEDSVYEVHYAPSTRTFLSAEPIRLTTVLQSDDQSEYHEVSALDRQQQHQDDV